MMLLNLSGFEIGKSLVIFAVIAGLAAGVVLVSKKENQIEINAGKSPFGAAGKNAVPTLTGFQNSDGGLMDWEEKIYGLKGYYLDSAPQNDPDNLTNKLTAALAQKVVDLNKDREDGKKGLMVPNPQKFVADFLKNMPADEYNFSAEKDFDPARIKISKDNGKQAVKKYLESFNSIIKRNFFFSGKLGKHIVRDAYQSGDFREFDRLISAYESAINEFYDLAVPSGWAGLHEEEIKLLISSKKVYEAMRRVKDPAKTALAIRGYYLLAFQSLDLKEKINTKAAADKIF